MKRSVQTTEVLKVANSYSRAEFDAVKNQLQVGGDLWNKYNIFRIAFSNHPEVQHVSVRCITTGLWTTVDVVTDQGAKRLTVYDGGNSNFERNS